MRSRASLLMLSVCTFALSACGQPPSASDAAPAETVAPEAGVHMDAETQARMGVAVQPIAAAQAAKTASGFARVMDVGPLAAIESEVSTAMAVAVSSAEEHKRLVALAAQDQAASRRSVEAAAAQATADAARANLAARRIGLEWGPGLEKMPDGERSRLLSDIATGKAALVRIDAPAAGADVTRVVLRTERGVAAIPVTLIGRAAAADARLQTSGVFGIVRGADAAQLAAGRLVEADLELGAEEQGFLLPDSALLRSGGVMSIYVKTGPETFEQRTVEGGHASVGGWFVSTGFAATDQIVTGGAASLLAAEAGPVAAE